MRIEFLLNAPLSRNRIVVKHNSHPTNVEWKLLTSLSEKYYRLTKCVRVTNLVIYI